VARPKVAIVGGGIVGLAHAWSAADRGCSVTIFERGTEASGASIRNFGMIWPIGQPAGELYDLAIASRKRWLALCAASGIWVHPCGSIHLAHQADEWAVLQEFQASAKERDGETALLSPSEVLEKSPGTNPRGLLGGLYSSRELCVNPRRVIREMPQWLARQFAVRLAFGTTVVGIAAAGNQTGGGVLTMADGRTEAFDRVIVCGGSDLRALFPELFAASGLRLCKLQMLKTKSQPAGWRLGPHLASGLTLRHYRNFEKCPSLPKLQQRIAAESPELDRLGIHVMASQNDAGEVILGDSHEYDAEIDPFDKMLIDDLIIRELRKVLCLPDWTISERWHGIYAKHPSQPAFEQEVSPGVAVCTGTGGAGMTMSFGLAERAWQTWLR
jgi:D-hydroxyproline dehydrogenase subunit beta